MMDTTSLSSHRLLVVDDQTEICNLLQDVGEACGFEVQCVHDSKSFQDVFERFKPTFTMLDLQLGARSEGDGIELLRFLAKQKASAQIVMMSGLDEKVIATSARLGKSHGLNILGYLKKPFNIHDVESLLASSKCDYKNPSLEQLSHAIKQQNFILHYQPKIDLTSRKVVAVEALVRWQPNDKLIVPPNNFIPLAEQSNLIRNLTDLTVHKAFQQCAKWHEKNLPLSIAINLSTKVLTDLSLPDDFYAMAQHYHVNPEHIIFEVTETALMQKPKVAMDVLTRLRIKGFHLSIDDFGIGYSSLVELYRMPFNEIKIDRSFVKLLESDEEAQVITHSIIQLGHNLGMLVTAEGVETPEAWKLLEALGCDMVQGYYIARPARAEDLEFWLLDSTNNDLKYLNHLNE